MTACCHVLRTSPNRAFDGSHTAVERVLQPGEQPLLTRLELPRGAFLAAQLRQLAQEALLLGVQLGRGLDLDVDDEVAPAAAAQVGDAPAVQRDRLAGLGTGPDVDLLHAV